MSEALKSKVAKSRKLTTPRKEDNSLTGQIDLYTPAYKTAMMGTDEDAARFARVLRTMVAQDLQLAKCAPKSIIGAALQAAEYKFSLTLNHCWIIPRWNDKKKCYEASFQIGLQGAEELFYRANPNARIEAHMVLSCDEFIFQYGENPMITHAPYKHYKIDANEVPHPTFVYAIIFYPNGTKQFEVMTVAEVEKIRNEYSSSYKYGKGATVWTKNPGEMFKNTVVKRVLKHTRKSIELASALANDFSVKYVPDMKQITDQGSGFRMLEQPSEADFVQSPTGEHKTKENASKTKPVEVITPPKARKTPEPKPVPTEIPVGRKATPPPQSAKKPVPEQKATQPAPNTNVQKDPIQDDEIALIISTVGSLYKKLNRQFPQIYDDHGIKSWNKKYLGMESAKGCTDIKKLNTLKAFLEGEVADEGDDDLFS